MKKLALFFLIFPFTGQAQTYGLSRLTDICSGSCNSVQAIISYKGLVYFAGTTAANGLGLYKSDGTVAGTVLVKELNSTDMTQNNNYATEGPVTANGIFYFGAKDNTSPGIKLWRSDGTASGTYVLTGPTQPTNIVELNGFVLFLGYDAVNGGELWRSDGTQAGTYLVKDINPGTASSLTILNYYSVLNNRLYFYAVDGVHGNEGWVSDGTSAGTFLIKDLCPGSGDGYFQNPIVYKNAVYYNGYSPTTGSGVYKTTGVAGDPTLAMNMSWSYIPAIINDTLYFAAYANPTANYQYNYELHCTDFSSLQPTLVKDIRPGSTNYPNLFFMTAIDNHVYFEADDGIHGQEVWISGGHLYDTQLLKDINPGSGGGAYTSFFRKANGKAYFIGQDAAAGREIWESDGTASGTVVYDILPGTSGANPFNCRDYNDELYLRASDGITGTELWKIGSGVIGIEEFENSTDGMKIYPNPVVGIVTVESQKKGTITVCDILGNRVWAQTIEQGKNEINLSNLSSGIYFLKAGSFTHKFIKQ